MKHTKGPWIAALALGLPRIISDRRTVCDLHIDEGIGALQGKDKKGAFKNPDLREEIAANARLIAAAPELLEALKALLDIAPIPSHIENLRIKDAAVKAITKAEGPIQSGQTKGAE